MLSKHLYYFIRLRILDIVSTLENVRLGGPEVEVNPLSRYLLEQGLGWFFAGQIALTALFVGLALLCKGKSYTLPIVVGLNWVTGAVVALNVLTLIVIYSI